MGLATIDLHSHKVQTNVSKLRKFSANDNDNDNDFISRIEIIQQVYYVVTIYTWEED